MGSDTEHEPNCTQLGPTGAELVLNRVGSRLSLSGGDGAKDTYNRIFNLGGVREHFLGTFKYLSDKQSPLIPIKNVKVKLQPYL